MITTDAIKLGYNDHGFTEFEAVIDEKDWYFWSHLASILLNLHGYNDVMLL